MDNNSNQNEEELKERLTAARLAMSPNEEKVEWRNREDYLQARKKEAAVAMVSTEQKARLEEEAKTREEILQKQKKIAALELIRKQEEEERKKNFAEEQKKRDEAAETERLQKIERIIQSKAEIKGLVRQDVGGPQTIRTLRDDIAETVKRDQVTASKIITQERALRQEANEQKVLAQKKKRANIVLATSIFFVIFGLMAIGVVWIQKKEEASIKVEPIKTSILFSDQQLKIDTTGLTKEAFVTAQKEAYKKLKNNPGTKDVTDLYFSKTIDEVVDEKIVSREVFLGATEYLATSTEITDNFVRFVKDDFMVGFLRDQNVSPFFIFKTNDYKYLADAMILSGKPIINELFGLFWTEDENNRAHGAVFQDLTLKNYDLRVLKNENDEAIAGYTFLDDETLLFFETESDFQKLLEAFLVSQTN